MLVHELEIISKLALPFLLSIPPKKGAGPPAARPALIFLHGYDEGPPAEIYAGLTAHGPLKPGSSPLAVGEFIVAAPQLPARGDLWHGQARNVCEIASYIHDNLGGDPARTYLTGFSYGGNGVFDIALQAPSLWAALWPVDPTRVPGSDPGLPVWLSAGEASRRNGPRFIERLGLQPPGVGEQSRVYLDRNLDHVGTATSAYSDDRIYRWLLSKNLP